MDSIQGVRVNNFVGYRGRLGEYKCIPVLSIDELWNGAKVYYFNRLEFPKETFIAQPEDLRGTILEERHLETLGLQKDKRTGYYMAKGLKVANLSYINNGDEPMKLDWIHLGFCIVPSDFPDKPTPQQMHEQGISIPYLNYLQNYCSDNSLAWIDFAAINIE